MVINMCSYRIIDVILSNDQQFPFLCKSIGNGAFPNSRTTSE